MRYHRSVCVVTTQPLVRFDIYWMHSPPHICGVWACGSIQSSYLKLLMLWMCKFSPKREQTDENKLKSFFLCMLPHSATVLLPFLKHGLSMRHRRRAVLMCLMLYSCGVFDEVESRAKLQRKKRMQWKLNAGNFIISVEMNELRWKAANI